MPLPTSTPAPVPTLSIVIPTRNEAVELPETLRRARSIPEVLEIIVVDSGSTDATCDLARDAGCIVLNSEPSRGGQLRKGCQHARGEVVLLLHADTWLPPDAGCAVLDALRDPGVVGGGFWKSFREKHPLMVGSRLRCALRLRLFGRILGDQAMFARRSVLEEIGGVPDMPLMEEFELCRLLRQRGTLVLADATVVTSIRRFIERGILRTYLRMGWVGFLYSLGVSPERLRKTYERK
jgi:rSAM/selenodomain-associated transferase 2